MLDSSFERNLAINAKRFPKPVFSYLNGQIDCKYRIRAQKDNENKVVYEAKEIVEILSEKFYETFSTAST
jgi:hypothetical protein